MHKQVKSVSKILLAGFAAIALGASSALAQFSAPATCIDAFAGGTNSSGTSSGISTTEPSIRVAPNGAVYVGAIRGVPSGIDMWTFNPAAGSCAFLASPDTFPFVTSPLVSVGIGGGDMDLQPTSDNKLTYSSLTLASITVGVDTGMALNGSETFASQPLGSVIPGDDRMWMAADASGGVFMSFHDVATNNIDVLHSAGGPGAGLVYAPAGQVFPTFNVPNNELGNIVFSGGALYQVSANGSNQQTVVVSTSADGGKTWTAHDALTDPKGNSLANIFPSIAVNGSNVYVVGADVDHVYAAISNDGGAHFGARIQLDSGLTASVFPWVAAGPKGADVVWYGTTNPQGNSSGGVFNVYMQQLSTTGLMNGNLLVDSAVKNTPICLSGFGCASDRDLGDFFQVAVEPATGLADIAYSKVTHDGSGNSVVLTQAVHQTGAVALK